MLKASFISVLLAALVCNVSFNLYPRFMHHAENVAMQQAIYRGEPFPVDGVMAYHAQLYNRLLFPTALRMLEGLRVCSAQRCYLFLRLATAAACFFVFFLMVVWCFRGPARVALFAQALLALGLISSFNSGWEHNTDLLDACFMSGFVWCALERRRWALLAVALLAVFNRESAAFAGVVWFFLWGRRSVKEAAFSAGVFLATVSLAVYVRTMVGAAILAHDPYAVPLVHQQIWVATIWRRIWEPGTPFHPFAWPWAVAGMFFPAACWLWELREKLDRPEKGLLQAAAVVVAFCVVLGLVDEARIYIPAMVLLVAAAARAESRSYSPAV